MEQQLHFIYIIYKTEIDTEAYKKAVISICTNADNSLEWNEFSL